MRQEVLTGIERRRRWSDAEKRSILAEVGVKGARVADVARRHDLTRQHIYQWRGEFRRRGESLVEETGFLPVEITAAPSVVTSAPVATATVEIVLATQVRQQIEISGWKCLGQPRHFNGLGCGRR